jgi:hypothetical protein
MTDLEKRASELTSEEIEELRLTVFSQKLSVTEETFCLWFIASDKCSEKEAKMFYQMHLNMTGQAMSGMY